MTLVKPAVALSLAAVLAVMAPAPPAAAQLGTRPAEDWIKVLESPERLAGLKVDEVVARLQLKPGDVVADLGAGTGPFLGAFAKAVPSGTVYAVEVDRGFVPYLEKKAAASANLRVVLGEYADPKLPASVDVAFMHDVLHHVQDRPAYMKRLATYLKPSARVALIDFQAAQGPHREHADLVVSKQDAIALMATVGFKPIDDIALFDDKWFVVFGR